MSADRTKPNSDPRRHATAGWRFYSMKITASAARLPASSKAHQPSCPRFIIKRKFRWHRAIQPMAQIRGVR